MEKQNSKVEQELCKLLEDQFRGASLAQSHLSREFMPEDKRDLLNAFSMYSGEMKFSAGKKMGEILQNYMNDIVNSVKEHPKTTITVVAAIIGLLRFATWAQGGAAGPAPQVDMNAIGESVDYVVDGQTIGTAVESAKNLTQSNQQSWHWDIVVTDFKNMIMTGSPMKKHYMGVAADNLATIADQWRAPLKAAMNLTEKPLQDGLASIRPADHPFLFEQGFNKTLPEVNSAWLMTNIPQDLSHSGYWYWSAQKGVLQGLAGTATLLKLFDPLVDLAHTAQAGLTDKIMFRDKDTKSAAEIRSILQKTDVPTAPAPAPEMAEPNIPRKEISGLWMGNQNLRLDQSALDQTLLQMDRMHVAATHIGAEGGMTTDARTGALKKEIAGLRTVIEGLRENPEMTAKDLPKHLSRVMAMEVAYAGRSNVYDIMNAGEAMDDKTTRKMNRLGHHILNGSDRAATRDKQIDFFYWRCPQIYAKAAVVKGATYVADGYSHLKNGIRLAKESKISDISFDPLIRTKNGLINLTTRPAFAATALMSGTSVYLDHAGKIQQLPQMLQPVAEAISHGTGSAAAAAYSTVNFLGWNVVVSDLAQVHLATGLALSTFFALAAHYPHKFVLKPLGGYAKEGINRLRPSSNNAPPTPQELI